MDLPFFYHENILSQNIIALNEDTSKHIAQVLRMKAGEKLKLTDGAGNILTAEITDSHKKTCTVKIIAKEVITNRKRNICVAISLLKNNNRFEWFLEKATEIGVTEIIPLLCGRTEKQHFRFERMKQIVTSAMLQSQQSWLPFLHQPVVFSKVVSSSVYTTKLIAHCADDEKVCIEKYRKESGVQILIGPEGDFSTEEIFLARQNKYLPVALGDTRLRTETAGVAAATLLCI